MEKRFEINCFCCNTSIKLLYDIDCKLDEAPWKNGTVVEVNPGYGSRFDEDRFYIAICDNCIEKGFTRIIKHNGR